MNEDYYSGQILRFRTFRMKSQIELMDCPVTPHLIELLTRALEIVLLRRSAMAALNIAEYREQQEHLFDAISETEVITDG